MWLVWLVIILVVAGAVTLVVFQQQGKLPGKSSRSLPPLERNVFTLQIGDIVQYLGTDWVVEGKLTYDDDGYTWLEYLLQDGDRIAWLSVDEDDRVEVALLEPSNQLDISTTPPKEITFVGETYSLVGSGNASMTRTGTTLNRTAERCQYYDYQGNDNKVLSIEVWKGEYEVTVGNRINPRMLSLLPGSGERLYGS
ncbi:MAG: DUF4178 domain-containing protein [Chroococcales cyanobacterium]